MTLTENTRIQIDKWMKDFDIGTEASCALIKIINLDGKCSESPAAAGSIQHLLGTTASSAYLNVQDPWTVYTDHAATAGSYSSCPREHPTSASGQLSQEDWQLDATSLRLQPHSGISAYPIYDAPTEQSYEPRVNQWSSFPDLTSHSIQSNSLKDNDPGRPWLNSFDDTLYPYQGTLYDDLPVTITTPSFDGTASRQADFSHAVRHSVQGDTSINQAVTPSYDQKYGFPNGLPCLASEVPRIKRKSSEMGTDNEDDPPARRPCLPSYSAVINSQGIRRYDPGHGQSIESCLRCKNYRRKVYARFLQGERRLDR